MSARARVFVTRPDGSGVERLAVDMAASLAWAAREHAAACFLRPRPLADEEVFSLSPASGVRRVEPRGLRGVWWRTRFGLGAGRARRAARRIDRRMALWIETYRELRRHAGDERLPYAWRARLRDLSQGAFARSRRLVTRPITAGFPRRLLRERVRVTLPPDRLVAARTRAAELGVSMDRPLVAIDAPAALGRFDDAVESLVADGCQVVRIGAGEEPLDRPGVVDLASQDHHDRVLDLYVLLCSRFLICVTTSAQRVAYLTDTPTLRLDARDPVADYPVRSDGVYLLAPAVDLGTGATVSARDMLTERYLRNPGRFGYRRNTAVEVLLAVREMKAGLEHGWRDTESQRTFRTLAADAGTALAATLPRMTVDGPEDGFIGDGRLARVQADRWL